MSRTVTDACGCKRDQHGERKAMCEACAAADRCRDARAAGEHIAENPNTTYTAAYRARATFHYTLPLGAAEGLI